MIIATCSWTEEDVKNALECCDVPPDSEKIAAVCSHINYGSHNLLEERMCDVGWDILYDIINEVARENEWYFND